jgi:hypothetical protein
MKNVSALVAIVAVIACGQEAWKGNHDEAQVGSYSLPDVLTLSNGKKVTTADEWRNRRRPEILKLLESNMYGPTPRTKVPVTYSAATVDNKALGGKAVRKQVTISFPQQPNGPKINILMYLPANAKGRVPVFVGLNFGGNHTVHTDPGIVLPNVWLKEKQQRAQEDSRGRGAQQWQIERNLDRGYGIVTAYYGDIEPDFNGGMPYGIRALMPGTETWGAVGAWAWGLSRIADYLATDKDVNVDRMAVMGHSRLGKAALWAGAQDERFSIVISNNSGEGGAALSKRHFGEDVWRLNNNFPHWFGKAYRQYANREPEMPWDQHWLLASIAPRPLYVASAAEDLHSDPKGEFLAAFHAGPVYGLFGKKGLGTDEMPGHHQPIMNDVGYHIRTGKHDVTAYDWDRYCDFADKHWRK